MLTLDPTCAAAAERAATLFDNARIWRATAKRLEAEGRTVAADNAYLRADRCDRWAQRALDLARD